MTGRNTRQRAAIRAALDAADEFRSAQQWHEALADAGAAVSLATVYRNLQALAEAGEVDAVRDHDGEVLYRRCLVIDTHHHHLRCRVCGTAVEVDGPMVESWAAEVADRHGFSDIQHIVELSGLCATCTPKVSE